MLFYFALAVLLVGLARKIRQYWTTPAPLKIPTMPAPLTRRGVALRMAREVLLFESLFRATKWTWVFGWMFHVGLALAFVRHLRYVLGADSFFWPLVNNPLAQFAGKHAGFLILVGLLGLLARRVFVDRVRYISAPSDYLMLILLGVIAASGVVMSFFAPIDVVAFKAFMTGLLVFDWQDMPASVALFTHLGAAAVLAIVFPFSKLLHAPGVFFSPGRNQVDNSRERRHLSAWAGELESTDGRGNKGIEHGQA